MSSAYTYFVAAVFGMSYIHGPLTGNDGNVSEIPATTPHTETAAKGEKKTEPFSTRIQIYTVSSDYMVIA